MRNFARLTHAANKIAQVQSGETCQICGAPATHKVGSTTSWRPACEPHARQAAAMGYDTMPPLQPEDVCPGGKKE